MLTSIAAPINTRLLAAVNAILAQALTGKSSELTMLAANPMLVEITDLRLRLLLSCVASGIYIRKLTPEAAATEARVQLAGTRQSLMQLALARDRQEEVSRHSDLHIAGNTAALYAWQRAFKGLSINWEGAITRRIGALPASVFISLLGQLQQTAQEINAELPAALQHMLVANRMVLDKENFAAFSQEVLQLRLVADGLRRRIDKHAIHPTDTK